MFVRLSYYLLSRIRWCSVFLWQSSGVRMVSCTVAICLALLSIIPSIFAQERLQSKAAERNITRQTPLNTADSAFPLSWWQTLRADTAFRIGGYAGLLFNSHTGGFRTLPGIPTCCSGFPDGSGTGWTVGALARWKMFDNVYGQMRVGVAQFGGSFTRSNDTIGFTAPISGGAPREVIAEHTLSTSLFALTLEPGIAVQPIKNLFVGLQVGIHPLLITNYDVQETVVEPTDFTYINRSRFWNVGSGAIPQRSAILFSGILGVGYEIPLNRKISIMPEARVFMPLNNVATVEPTPNSWKVTSLSLGVQLLWRKVVIRPEDMRILRDTVLQRDTNYVRVYRLPKYRTELIAATSSIERIPVSDDTILERFLLREEYRKEIIAKRADDEVPQVSDSAKKTTDENNDQIRQLSAQIRVVGIQPNNQREDNPTVIVEEFEGEEHFPLLPHVYFQEGRSDVNESRMKLSFPSPKPPRFEESAVPTQMLGVYAELLNIIGARLQQHSTAALVLTGTVSNTGSESNNLALAKERADAVKNYFEQVWKIDPARITVEWQLLPQNPSSLTTKDGQEENRRVEIASSDSRILAPVVKRDTIRTITPPRLELLPTAQSGSGRGIASWRMDAVQADSTVGAFSGVGTPTPRIINLQEQGADKRFAVRTTEPITARLFVTDSTGEETIASTSLAVQQRTLRSKRIRQERDKRIDQFSLILFDFDKSSLSDANQAIMETIIKRSITSESTIVISAYADRQGSLEYNRALAERRAQEVRTLLTQSSLALAAERISVDAVGNSILLFDNTHPEGRGYSRIVQIRIETPLK